MGCLFLCHYALDIFRGRDIMMALENHTHSIYRGQILKNPFGGSAGVAAATLP